MKRFTNKFRSLPIRTKQIIGVGIIFFLVVVLPLFIWAILTQKFFFKKEAQTLLTCNQTCTFDSQCESTYCNPSADPGGLCRNRQCPNDDTCSCASASPSPTPTPDVCVGQRNGSSCEYWVCPVCNPGTICPKFPCSSHPGICDNQQCSAPSPTPTPTPTPTNAVGGGTPTPNPSGTPNSCGGTCGSNSNCDSGLVCYQDSCRNGFCPNNTNCSCTSPTPKPTVKPTGKASPTPTPTVTASTTESPTPLATEIATAVPEITPEATLQPSMFNTLINNYMIVLGGGLFVIVLLGLLIFVALRRKSKDNIPPINPPTSDTGSVQNPPVSEPTNTNPVEVPPVNFNDQNQTVIPPAPENGA